MDHNKKAIKRQQTISVNQLKNSDPDFLQTLISDQTLSETIDNNVINCRNRIYTPIQTLSMFVSQALNQDSSCQSVVNKIALKREKKTSISTSAYCKARNRLPVSIVANLTKEIALKSEQKVNSNWRFRGRDIYLVDGTTLTMPDTVENQKKYPQPRFQKDGLGFPICRIVGIVSLTTGSIIDAAIGSCGGKGSGEQALLRDMLGQFKKGDIILADAMFSTYSMLTYAIEQGIDVVFVQNGARSRKTDFTQGEILGKNDHIIAIKRPKDTPEWMDEEEAASRPKEIRIRELKIGGKILITTMLCPKETKAETIKHLYTERWHIEVDFRNIKITLGLDTFKCKTPQMVIKEMWTHFLAYNLIRSLMLDSALYNKILPRQISFKHSLQLYISYLEILNILEYTKLLQMIGKKLIGNRAGRVEPRAIKKRHNGFALLMKPRNMARAEIIKNGHPKRIK